MNAFIGKVVRKDLAFLVKGGLPVPTYVLEYLLGQYCATDDQEAIEAGLESCFCLMDFWHIWAWPLRWQLLTS